MGVEDLRPGAGPGACPKLDEILAADGWRQLLDIEEVASSHSRQLVREVMTRSLVTTTLDTQEQGSRIDARPSTSAPSYAQPGPRELLGGLTQRDLLGVVYLDVRDMAGLA